MQESLVKVICDTNFLIHIATKPIKNVSSFETEIGQIQFVVPLVVIKELQKLSNNLNKKQKALRTLDFIKQFKTIPITGNFADKEILRYIKEHRGIIATMDTDLKNKIKRIGGSIISISNERIILEPSKI